MARREIDIDDNVLRVAMRVVRCNWMPYLGAVLLLLASNAAIGFWQAPLAFAVMRALILMITGYAAYHCLVSGGAVAGWAAVATGEGRVPWRYAGVALIILAPILLLGIVWTAPGTGTGPSGPGDMALGVVLVVTYAALNILFGTALPSVAARGKAALGEAFRRGSSNYRRIGRDLVFGVWLFRAAASLIIIVMAVSGVTTDFIPPDGGPFQIAAAGPMLLFNASHVFAECLSAVVLLRAYRRYLPAPGTAAEPVGAEVERRSTAP